MKIGIIVAMSKEYELLQGIEFPQHEIKLVRSGIGKVNAAMSAIELINDFNPDLVINSGVAGGIDTCLNVADLVIGTETCYHDFYAGEVSDHLKELGFDPTENDIRFVEDNWENPTLGAWGLGWEVWLNGMEVTQFTYFQQVGGLECSPVTGEVTYGLERLAMYLQEVDSVYDLKWNDEITYGEVFQRAEYENSVYAFEECDTEMLFNSFDVYEKEALRLMEKG